MKSTTKLTIKILLIISLFASAIIADEGHMPGGGFSPSSSPTPIVCYDEGHMPGGGVVPCPDTSKDGHMPGGGRAADLSNDTKAEESFLDFVRNYLYSLFG